MGRMWIVPLIVLTLAAGGCKTSDTEDDPILLTLSSLVPAARARNLPAFNLTLNGGGFASGASAECNGRPVPTTLISSSVLTARIEPEDIPDQPGAPCAIQVRQGGQVSASLPLVVIADPVFSTPVDIGGIYDRLDERNVVGFKYGLYAPGQGQVMIITGLFEDGTFQAALRQSGDYGSTFGAPTRLQRNGMFDIFDFAVSPAGHIHVLEKCYAPGSAQDGAYLSTRAAGQDAWVSRLLTKTPGTGWMNARFYPAANGDEYILMTWEATWVRSSDHGRTWSEPRALPVQDQYTRGDFLFLTPAGRLALAWSRWGEFKNPPYERGSSWISGSADDGVTWDHSFLLPEMAGLACAEPETSMVQDENGAYYLFSRRGARESEMRAATSTDDGRTWRYMTLPALGLPAAATFWDLQADSRFNLDLLFLEWAGEWNKMYFLRSSDRGVTWSAPAVISVPAEYAVLGAKMAVDESGVVHLLLRAALKPTELYGAANQHLFYCNSR
jgi:hypothetical protein